MSAHTPGPWKSHHKPWPKLNDLWEIHWSDIGECVAEIVHGEANARLIAAAPEMFELLKYIKKVFDDGPTDGIPEIGTLIQKIEGDK